MYRIGQSEWHLWRGPPPAFVQEQVEHYIRPGTDSIGIQTLGLWAPPFEVELEAHFPDYLTALLASKRVVDQPRRVVRVIYETIDYAEQFKHEYAMDRFDVLDVRAVPRLLGPDYDYPGGGRLICRAMLTPIRLPSTEAPAEE